MSLLLLFSDQVAPAASGDVVTSLLIETEPGVWYDATADLISGNTRRGRQQELDQYQAGVAEVLLDNDDRTYDPTFAASPLYGYVAPMAGVQVRNTYAGTTWPLFTGYADRWIQNREGPHRGTTSLIATDGFKILARARLAASVYAQEVLPDGPAHWWRLDEPSTATTVHDAVGDRDGTPQGTVTLGEETLIARDGGQAISGDAIGDVVRLPVGAGPSGTGPFTVEFVIRTGTDPSSRGRVFASTGLADVEMGVGAQAFGFSPPYMWIGTSQVLGSYVEAASIGDGLTHHLAYVRQDDGTLKVYVDGVDQTGSVVVSTDSILPNHTWDFGSQRLSVEDVVSGTFDELAVYDYALAADRIAAHAAAVATPWDGDNPGTRIGRILDAVAWPDDLRDLDDGDITLQPADLATTALEHVQKVAESEFGNLYVNAAGVLRFEQRTSLVNQPVAAAFSDAAGADLPITYSAPELSEDLIRNEVTISRADGVAQTVTDPDSVDRYGPISYTRDGLLHDDDVFSRHAAEFLVAEYGDPVERVNAVTVDPYRDPAALWPVVLELELTDRVTLEETPVHVAPAVTRTLVVEGISHTFGPKAWETVYDLSPAYASGTATTCILQLDTGPCGLDDARLYF